MKNIPSCEKCKKRECEEMGKPCKVMETYLRDCKIYGAEWIRPQMPSNQRTSWNRWRELPFSVVKPPETDI